MRVFTRQEDVQNVLRLKYYRNSIAIQLVRFGHIEMPIGTLAPKE
jgi:hypothetical protein